MSILPSFNQIIVNHSFPIKLALTYHSLRLLLLCYIHGIKQFADHIVFSLHFVIAMIIFSTNLVLIHKWLLSMKEWWIIWCSSLNWDEEGESTSNIDLIPFHFFGYFLWKIEINELGWWRVWGVRIATMTRFYSSIKFLTIISIINECRALTLDIFDIINNKISSGKSRRLKID